MSLLTSPHEVVFPLYARQVEFLDAPEFINVVRSDYLARIDREVRDSIGLYDSAQWEEFLRRYVQTISLVLKKEKQKNFSKKLIIELKILLKECYR